MASNDSWTQFGSDLTSWGEEEDATQEATKTAAVQLATPAPAAVKPAEPSHRGFVFQDYDDLEAKFSPPEKEEKEVTNTGQHSSKDALLNKLSTGRWVADFSMACASIGATVALTGIPPVTAVWTWFAEAILNSPGYVPWVAALPYMIVTLIPVILGVLALVTSFSFSAKERSWKFRKTLRYMSGFSISTGVLLMVLVLTGVLPVFSMLI